MSKRPVVEFLAQRLVGKMAVLRTTTKRSACTRAHAVTDNSLMKLDMRNTARNVATIETVSVQRPTEFSRYN